VTYITMLAELYIYMGASPIYLCRLQFMGASPYCKLYIYIYIYIYICILPPWVLPLQARLHQRKYTEQFKLSALM
jgi:hypothetical protein